MKTKSILKNDKVNLLFLLLLTIMVLFFSLKGNFVEVVNQIKNLDLFWVFIAILLTVGYWFFGSLAMHLISKKFKSDLKFNSIFKLNIVTHFFNGVTPFASGGQPYQIYALTKKKISLVDSTNIAIETFVTYQLALIMIGSVAIISNKIFNIFPDVAFLKILVLIGFLINLFVGAGLFAISFTQKINRFVFKHIINLGSKLKIVKDKEKTTEKFNNDIEKFHNGTKHLISDKKNLVKIVLLQLLSLITYYSVPVAILFSMGDFSSFNIMISIITTAYVMIIGAFVPLPGGTGGLEYSFLALFGNFIVGSKLTTLMIMWRFVTYYFGMICGAVLFNINRRKSK